MQSPSRSSPFGGYLKSLREARGWPLEELARGFGSDRANIHRIESGRGRPRYETVQRLVEALKATPHEAIELYERAGYQAPVWPTTASDFKRIRTELQTPWLRNDPPASVVSDVFWRVWHVNGAFAKLFTSKSSSQIAGIHYLKLCLDPEFGFREAISRLVVADDVDVFLCVVTARFRRRLMSNRGGVSSEKDLDRLKQLPGFDDLWERTGPGSMAPGDYFLDFVRLRLHGGGAMIVQSTSIVPDRRFLFTNYLPTDEKAAMTLGAVLSSSSAHHP